MSKVQISIREGKQKSSTITAEKSTREIIYSNVFLPIFKPGFWYSAILLIISVLEPQVLFAPIVVANLIGIVFKNCGLVWDLE